MNKVAILAAAAVALAFVSGTAVAGPVGLYAYDAKGKLAKAGKYGRWTRIYKPADVKKLKAKTQKKYAVKKTFCGKPFQTRKVHERWIAAHKKAKHKVVLRERVAKGKMKKVCDV